MEGEKVEKEKKKEEERREKDREKEEMCQDNQWRKDRMRGAFNYANN